jgi:hypothetical protein
MVLKLSMSLVADASYQAMLYRLRGAPPAKQREEAECKQ